MLAAKTFLEQAAVQNLPEFLKALSDVLAGANNSSVARTAAGLQLKNHLKSKDEAINVQYQQRWLVFPEHTRLYIKKNVSVLYLIHAYIVMLICKTVKRKRFKALH